MLSKKHRLPIQEKKVFIYATHSPIFTLKHGKNQLQESRFGVIISKRIDKRAVVRNKIKRMIMEYARTRLDRIKTSTDILFIIKPAIKEKKQEEIEKEIENAFLKAKLYI